MAVSDYLFKTWEEENAREDAGTLEANDRQTCYTCCAWATEEHIESDAHFEAVFEAVWHGIQTTFGPNFDVPGQFSNFGD